MTCLIPTVLAYTGSQHYVCSLSLSTVTKIATRPLLRICVPPVCRLPVSVFFLPGSALSLARVSSRCLPPPSLSGGGGIGCRLNGSNMAQGGTITVWTPVGRTMIGGVGQRGDGRREIGDAYGVRVSTIHWWNGGETCGAMGSASKMI